MTFCAATGLPLPSRPGRTSDWGDWRCLCCDPPVVYCQDCGARVDENNMQCTAYLAAAAEA